MTRDTSFEKHTPIYDGGDTGTLLRPGGKAAHFSFTATANKTVTVDFSTDAKQTISMMISASPVKNRPS